jgi:hypothetical protein
MEADTDPASSFFFFYVTAFHYVAHTGFLNSKFSGLILQTAGMTDIITTPSSDPAFLYDLEANIFLRFKGLFYKTNENNNT